jgi:hypothetical protein
MDHEEEENLTLIDLADCNEVGMPSSPPHAPSYKYASQSPLPILPATPCPHQRHIQLHESLHYIIRERRTVSEDSLAGQEKLHTALFGREAVSLATVSQG